MDYEKTLLKEEIVIKRIVSIHYFEYAKDYVFEGEKHDFWEFLYVDKGEVEVMAQSLGFKLKQGEIIFISPMNFIMYGQTAKSLLTSLLCPSSVNHPQ